MKTCFWNVVLGCAAAVTLSGCGDGETKQPSEDDAGPLGPQYLLATEPDGALGVIEARESTKDDDDVVVVGRIGGFEYPFTDDHATFTIVDPSLLACSDIEGDECEKPWDYCCEPKESLAQATAIVFIVNGAGKVERMGARELLAVKELQTVVVQGKAQRDDKGNLEIQATGVFVRKES